MIQFAVDAGADAEIESKNADISSANEKVLKADKVRSQIPMYSHDGTLRSGVSMSSLASVGGGYATVDRRERAMREKGAMAAGGPQWGYMTADRRGNRGYSSMAGNYAPGYATIGSGYVNGHHNYRYEPEYTPAGYATVDAGGYHGESGFLNAGYGK